MSQVPWRVCGAICLCLAWVLCLGGCHEHRVQPKEAQDIVEPMFEAYGAQTDPAAQLPRAFVPIPEPSIVESGDYATLVYTCKYTRCEIMREAIEGMTSLEGVVQASTMLNAVIVKDQKDRIRSVLALLESLDREVPQVLVEARVVEVSLDSDLEYEIENLFKYKNGTFNLEKGGVSIDTPGANPTVGQGMVVTMQPWVAAQGQLDLAIRLLLTRGKAKLLSSPNLLVSLGNEASIITGEEVPVQTATVVSGSVSTTTQFKRVGIKLRVKPLQITGDTAQLEINPEVSAVTGFTSPGPGGVANPIVAIRNVSSILTIKDGEVLTIGGLLRSEERDQNRKVPGLGDVPVLGLAFQGTRLQANRTQLIFFLRVNILDRGQAHGVRIHRPGSSLDATLRGPATLSGPDESKPDTPDAGAAEVQPAQSGRP